MNHRRAIRSTSVAALVTLAALTAPATARAQVAHLPEKSPYEDVKIGQTLTVMGGWLAVQRDLADVAPASSWMTGLRYDIGVGGPASSVAAHDGTPGPRHWCPSSIAL